MKTDRRVVFAILAAGLLFSTGILLRDILLVHVIKPMALMLWMTNRLIASIDQAAYWALLILILIGVSLLRFFKRPPVITLPHPNEGNPTLDSMRHWRTLILLTSDESSRLNFLKNGLQSLLNDITASRHPSQAAWETYADMEQGTIKLPESIRKFFLLDPPPPKPRPTLMQRLAEAPDRLLARWKKPDRAEYYQSIAEVIAFMEKQLENDDEP